MHEHPTRSNPMDIGGTIGHPYSSIDALPLCVRGLISKLVVQDLSMIFEQSVQFDLMIL